MRFFRSLLLAALLLVLWAVPASGAEVLTMACPVCDHVDVAGRGMEPNATLTLTITDVKSGQTVLPETRITSDSSGSFSREFDMDLAKHPALLGNLYERTAAPSCWPPTPTPRPRPTADGTPRCPTPAPAPVCRPERPAASWPLGVGAAAGYPPPRRPGGLIRFGPGAGQTGPLQPPQGS